MMGSLNPVTRLRTGGFRPGFPGQWAVVSLPVSQQRVLQGIESALEGGEPRLRSMFAIFTRLTREDGAPRTESLPPRTSVRRAWLVARRRAIIAIPVVLGLAALLSFLAVSGNTAHPCRSGTAPWVTSCQSAPESHGHSQAG
jgi:hypothetical protein